MPNVQPVIEQPHFVIDEAADESVRDRLLVMERRIQKYPEAYQSALQKLGDLATAETIDYKDLNQRQVTLQRNAKQVITEYFRERLDLDMSFDTATEAALQVDSKHQELLDNVKSKHAEHIKLGVMKSTNRPNESAVPAREALRRHRLEFYIGRVIDAKSPELRHSRSLRSTG